MTKAPNFGFSALLKVLHLKETPQKSSIRKRYKPSEGGYDYHKNLRKRIQWLATGTHSLAEALATLGAIKKKPERNSTERALKKFSDWRAANPQVLLPSCTVRIASPRNVFGVKFSADFAIKLGVRHTVVHIWNTQVELSRDITLALLTQVAKGWPDAESRPDDFAVLSLQTGETYKWSDASKRHVDLGIALFTHIEHLCEMAAKGAESPTMGDQPTSHPS